MGALGVDFADLDRDRAGAAIGVFEDHESLGFRSHVAEDVALLDVGDGESRAGLDGGGGRDVGGCKDDFVAAFGGLCAHGGGGGQRADGNHRHGCVLPHHVSVLTDFGFAVEDACDGVLVEQLEAGLRDHGVDGAGHVADLFCAAAGVHEGAAHLGEEVVAVERGAGAVGDERGVGHEGGGGDDVFLDACAEFGCARSGDFLFEGVDVDSFLEGVEGACVGGDGHFEFLLEFNDVGVGDVSTSADGRDAALLNDGATRVGDDDFELAALATLEAFLGGAGVFNDGAGFFDFEGEDFKSRYGCNCVCHEKFSLMRVSLRPILAKPILRVEGLRSLGFSHAARRGDSARGGLRRRCLFGRVRFRLLRLRRLFLRLR